MKNTKKTKKIEKKVQLPAELVNVEQGRSFYAAKPDLTNDLDTFANVVKDMPVGYFDKVELLTHKGHKIDVSNATHKGVYKSSIVYLLQEKLSGFNVCPYAEASCKEECLGTKSGHSSMIKAGNKTNLIQLSRLKKTVLYFRFREVFIKRLFDELTKFAEKCVKLGVTPAFRFNGTSDIEFHKMIVPVIVNRLKANGNVEHRKLTFVEYFNEKFNMKLYDYTKSFSKAKKFVNGELPTGYHLTYSYTPENEDKAREILALGGNVAVAFATKKSDEFLGKTFLNARVITGDISDLRFTDPVGGYIIGLTAKGYGFRKTNTYGFFVAPTRCEELAENA